MDTVQSVSVQDVVNIITFIAPGYFATAIYTLRFAKSERAFAKVIIESIAWSLPIVAISNLIWERVLDQPAVKIINTTYIILLLGLSSLMGLLFTELRLRWPIKQLALWLGLASPDEDFLRSHFDGMKNSGSVAVELKNGKKFSGAPSGGSIHSKNGPRRYCFNYVVWYDKEKDDWIENPQDESILVDLAEVEYIVTPIVIPVKPISKVQKIRNWLKIQAQDFGPTTL